MRVPLPVPRMSGQRCPCPSVAHGARTHLPLDTVGACCAPCRPRSTAGSSSGACRCCRARSSSAANTVSGTLTSCWGQTRNAPRRRPHTPPVVSGATCGARREQLLAACFRCRFAAREVAACEREQRTGAERAPPRRACAALARMALTRTRAHLPACTRPTRVTPRPCPLCATRPTRPALNHADPQAARRAQPAVACVPLQRKRYVQSAQRRRVGAHTAALARARTHAHRRTVTHTECVPACPLQRGAPCLWPTIGGTRVAAHGWRCVADCPVVGRVPDARCCQAPRRRDGQRRRAHPGHARFPISALRATGYPNRLCLHTRACVPRQPARTPPHTPGRVPHARRSTRG